MATDRDLEVPPHDFGRPRRRRHVVLLIHGIRTYGEWAQRTAAVLEADPEIRVRPIRYDFFDVLRFLTPVGRVRQKPVDRILALVRDELSRQPASISIVAHSFGTFVASQLLEQDQEIRLRRLVLCGSIVPDGFSWEHYTHRLGTDADDDWHVVNDCGMQDIWPVIAKSITWGFGSSGRFGFGHTRVRDRFFPIGHSGFFEADFARRNWAPYISEGLVVDGVLDRPATSWWISLLTVVKLRYLILLSLVGLGCWVFQLMN
jgi:pimeloyl-ACP methyl ester carboxylesterase